MEERPPTPGVVFARRMREARERRPWTQQELADELAALGYPISRVTIAKIEQGGEPGARAYNVTRARNVSLEDALAISAALDVAPLALMLPQDDDELVAITPSAQTIAADAARDWIMGNLPITAAWSLTDKPGEQGDIIEHRTIDGRVIPYAEAQKRQRYYETEVSSGEWKLRQIGGLSHLREETARFLKARVAGDAAAARRELDLIANEIERQRSAIDKEGAA